MKSYKELAFAVTAISEMHHISHYPIEIINKWLEENNYTQEELKNFVRSDENYRRLANESGFFGAGPGERTAKMLRNKHIKAITHYFGSI